MSKSMRVRVLTLLLILGYGEVSANNHGDNDSARVTNYTPVAAPLSTKKWLSFPSPTRSTTTTTEVTAKKEYKRWTGLKYSGYIRSYNQFRTMPQHYTNAPQADQLLTLNGLDILNNSTFTGYQEPLFLLRLEGSPTTKTWFQSNTCLITR